MHSISLAFYDDNGRYVLLGGLQPKKTERYRKFQIWDWFFFRFFSVFFGFFSVFPFWPILTGLTASC